MAEGEAATPILRPGVVSSSVIPQAPPPGVPVVGAQPNQAGGYDPSSIDLQSMMKVQQPNMAGYHQQQPGHNGMPNSAPFESGSIHQNSQAMHQISLTSPPPVPTNMRNAEFY